MYLGTTTTSSSSSSPDTKHIFISYNHGSKKTVLRLRDQLKAAGFVVWVDEEGVCTFAIYDHLVVFAALSNVYVCRCVQHSCFVSETAELIIRQSTLNILRDSSFLSLIFPIMQRSC